MKVATVFDNSEPLSIIRKQSGIISVDKRKLMTSLLSTFTSAPITPSAVSRKYSKGLFLFKVFRKG
jgi:hypothetical protein